MADDGDVDVVFENSALYDHLQNVGFQPHEFESESHRPQQVREYDDAEFQSNVSLSKAFFHHLHASWLTWLGVGDEWTQQQQEMDKTWGEDVCRVALGKDALEPEDAEFLENVSLVQRQEDQPENHAVSKSSRYGLERLLSVGVGVTAYTTARLFYPRATAMTMTYDWIVGLFGLLLILPPSIRLLRTYAYRRQHKRMLRSFTDVLYAAEKWRKVTRRCVRLIQEMELVARGFTLVSRVSPAERLEAGSLLEARRQCPELRRLILLTSRDLMIHMRNATNDLIRDWPLGAEMETMYLCQVSLDEYGTIITATDEDVLASTTENYGLTPIKAVLEICNLQLSEFIKRSVLMCMVLAPGGAKPSKSPNTEGGDIFNAALPKASSRLITAASSLETSYNVHRCGLLLGRESSSEQKDDTQEEEPPAGRRRHQLSHTFTAVHSLDLHLQAGLRRVRAMGDELEELCTHSTTLEGDLKNRLSDELDKVKADLDACIECWDEAVLHVRKSGRQTRSAVPQSGNGPRKEVPEHQRDPIPLFEMGDPVVPDQVFEGYTEEDGQDSGDWGTDELLSPEEKEKKKQEKKEALRLLKELKTVIAVRAADWEKREEKARQRMSSHPKTNVPTDPKDTGKNMGKIASDIKDFKEGTLSQDQQRRSPTSAKDARQRFSRSSEESGDTDQRELARQDCVHTCGEDSEDNNTEELVEDLHEDLVNLAEPTQTALFESRSDDEDIFGDVGDFSDDDEEDNDPDRVDPANVEGESEGAEARLALLKEKLSKEAGAGLGFSASAVAAMAAQRSQVFGKTESQTFGDSDSDDEGVIEG